MVSENIKEAVRKCNPQKAIYALGEIVDSFQAGITNAQSTADQAIKNVEYATNIAKAAQKAAEEATQNVGEAFDTARASPNSSTIIMEYIRINGNEQNVALPVVNTTNAGILNANDYKFFQEYDARIRAVEGVSKIYLVELPSDNPSSQQITLAYTSQWPDAPNPPLEGTVVVDPARNNLSYRWNTQSNTWYKISEVAIQQFTNTTLGTIKGSTSDGEVQANADGTGSVTGWDIVKGNISTLQENALSNIRGVGSSVGMNLELINQNNQVKNTVALPVATDVVGGVVSPQIMQKINNLSNPIPLLRISPEGNMAITRDNKGDTSFSRYFLTISSQILAGISYHQSLFWFSSINSPIYDTDLGEGTYFTGISYDTVKPSEVTVQIDNAIKTWNANWYGGGTLYLKFRVHAAQMNSDTAAVFYYTPQFPTQDKYICEVLIQINGAGIQILSDTVNPDLVATDTVTIAYGATAYVLTLTYAGTTRPA